MPYMQGFVTDHDTALNDLYGPSEQNSKKFNDTISTMATRIATTFASLKVCCRTSFAMLYSCPQLISSRNFHVFCHAKVL